MSVAIRFGKTEIISDMPPLRARLRSAVRNCIAEEVERLVGILDTMDGDADFEPSLGWPEGIAAGENACTVPAIKRQGITEIILGGADDREDDAGDCGEEDEDREPTLGWTVDGELGAESAYLHDEDEPSLGWTIAESLGDDRSRGSQAPTPSHTAS